MSKQYWMDRLDNDGDFGTLAADAERKGMDVYAQNEDRDAAPSGDTSVIELTQKCLTRFWQLDPELVISYFDKDIL